MSGQIASVFAGSKLRIAATVVVALLAVTGGLFATGVLGAPAVTGVENRFGDVTDETTTIHTNLSVSNPNPLGIELGGVTVNYTVDMNDVRIASGQKSGVAIDAGNATVNTATQMRNERIVPWWRSHVRNGEHTVVTISPEVHSSTLGRTFEAPTVTRDVNTDMLSQFNSSETRPVNASSPVVSDPVLYINQTNASWGQVNESVTPLNLRFVVYNPKSYPITVSRLGYDIAMNDVAVGDGTSESGYVIPAKSTKTIETTTYIRNENLDEWWVSHLERNQVTDLRIDFHARLDVGGQTVRIPLDALTYEEEIETDIFGTKPTTANATDDSAAGAESGSQTETGDDSDATATPTATPTETDDGGLLGDGTATPTETAEPTSAPEPTATETETTGTQTTTDDGLFSVSL
ncbi:LEA type 2 family protein [Halogeometricum limi]|uniref:LEA14-like dessication related protein n=1 Tax=Halogeometricum limi TaxID=555875 RepID=A0A1I6GPM1_9EURY|nr:LEA type 2 family protein [Halogeometricum limi]SFR44173.1 LEA14-like dessication related protein [Halogeometricum limi]